jgi:ATP-dependent DNA helicase RecG
VYPTTEGVQQGRLRRLTELALAELTDGGLKDYLTPEVLDRAGLPSLEAALRYVHRPPPEADIELLNAGRHPTQRRLSFEELLAHQLSLRLLRETADRDHAWPLPRRSDLVERCVARLPFSLTAAQQRAWREIAHDLERNHPMMRLVQGDVGSGKTVVAALAALRAVEHGAQAAVMAPTELLAEQHARNFVGWLDPLGVRVGLLTGRLTGRARAALAQDIAQGAVGVAVGTHALFQAGVAFARLGLAIVDEQHRFGVHQRMELREKGLADGRYPHQLVMTATPIPRTRLTGRARSRLPPTPISMSPSSTSCRPDASRCARWRSPTLAATRSSLASRPRAARDGRRTGSAR